MATMYLRVQGSTNPAYNNPCAFPLKVGENKLVILQKVGYPQSYVKSIRSTISKYKNVEVEDIIYMNKRVEDFNAIEAVSTIPQGYISGEVCRLLEKLGAEC